jgi:HAD superfamily hydrolase (TIGR01509 family)
LSKPTLEALIFDVDGTLADTEGDGHRIAFNRAFAAAGLPWEWSNDLYGELLVIAGGKERIRHYLDHYCPDFNYSPEPELLIVELHQAKNHYYQALVSAGEIPLRPGVRRLIQEAKIQGMRLAIATTSALPNVLALLEATLGPEAVEWFEVIAAGDMVPAKKPAPDIYTYVLKAMNLPPETCLALEDSHHGLSAAAQAGIKTLVTVNRYTKHQDFSQATVVLDHLGEPDQPFQLLAGTPVPQQIVDLDLLRQWHQGPGPDQALWSPLEESE